MCYSQDECLFTCHCTIVWQVIGMPSPEMKRNFIYDVNNKFLGKCRYGRHSWIRLAMDCERMVEKGIHFTLCLGTSYDISSMESVGNYSVVFVDGKSMPLKKNYLSIYALSSGTSTNPYFPLRRAYLFTLCNFYFYLSLIFSYKAPTREHYDHAWALDVANIRVC